MKPEWVESLLQICEQQNVNFFFKQWGGVQKSKAGRMLHGRTFDDMPERNIAPMPDRKTRLSAALAYSPSKIDVMPLVQVREAC